MGQNETAAGAEGAVRAWCSGGEVSAMIPENHVVYPSKAKTIVWFVVLGFLFTPPFILSFTLVLAGFFYLSWSSSLMLAVILATPLVWTFLLIAMLLTLIRDVPRLEIGWDGFVLHQLGIARCRPWNDIEGDFRVRFTPLGRGIRYRLSEAFRKSREQATPPEKVGTSEWMLNTFQIPPSQLAELLNECKKRVSGS
jgi:hypothetical protein